ncbi:hypothetical protein ACOMHN_039366 [Nucella lapillus]
MLAILLMLGSLASSSYGQSQMCLIGIDNCREATSFTTDSAGLLHCCPPGSNLRMVQADGKGQMKAGCTCFSGHTGGVLSSILGMAGMGGGGGGGNVNPLAGMNSGMLMSALSKLGFGRSHLGGNNNNNGKGQNGRNETAVGGQSQNNGGAQTLGKQFSRGLATWRRNFGQNMYKTGLDLARNLGGVVQSNLNSTAVPIQRALTGLFGNIFRSIPRY